MVTRKRVWFVAIDSRHISFARFYANSEYDFAYVYKYKAKDLRRLMRAINKKPYKTISMTRFGKHMVTTFCLDERLDDLVKTNSCEDAYES